MDLENSVVFTSKFYLKFLSFAYNSAATDQNLFIFGMGYLGGFSSIVHPRTPGLCPRAGLESKSWTPPITRYNNKVVYCSLFIQTTY